MTKKKKKLSEREKKFTDAIKDLRFLIADPTSSRKSFRSLLSHYGIKADRIVVTEGFAASVDAIRSHKPHILFADLSLGDHQGLTLLDHQRAVIAPGETRIFFLSTSKNSKLLFSGAAEESVDAIIAKPFTFESLNHVFVERCNSRLDPTPYQRMTHLAQDHLNAGNLEKALELSDIAKRLDPSPSLAWAIEGRAKMAERKFDEALRSFERGVVFDPGHYRSLVGALECCVELGQHVRGYEIVRQLSDCHTIPLQKLPDLIRLAILSGNFAEILKFYQFADAIADAYPASTQYLAAGLVVCGMYFARKGSRTEAIDAFRKAEVACRRFPKIQKRLLCAMIESDFVDELAVISDRMPPEVQTSVEVRLAELHRMSKRQRPIEVLQRAIDLNRQGYRAPELFEILIQKSIELNRSQINIDEILHEANAAFPEHAAHFRELASRGKTSPMSRA